MVNFKFQNILYLELRNFSKLKLIEIDLDALILTKTFYENVSELTSLSELKLNYFVLILSLDINNFPR